MNYTWGNSDNVKAEQQMGQRNVSEGMNIHWGHILGQRNQSEMIFEEVEIKV